MTSPSCQREAERRMAVWNRLEDERDAALADRDRLRDVLTTVADKFAELGSPIYADFCRREARKGSGV